MDVRFAAAKSFYSRRRQKGYVRVHFVVSGTYEEESLRMVKCIVCVPHKQHCPWGALRDGTLVATTASQWTVCAGENRREWPRH